MKGCQETSMQGCQDLIHAIATAHTVGGGAPPGARGGAGAAFWNNAVASATMQETVEQQHGVYSDSSPSSLCSYMQVMRRKQDKQGMTVGGEGRWGRGGEGEGMG